MNMTEDWNFDEIIDRKNTCSMKWEPDVLCTKFGKGNENLLPMWVADMDFKCPSAVTQAIVNRAAHEVYGYAIPDPAYDKAVISWFRRRHQCNINAEWIITTPGIVCATNYLIQCFSKPGDKILIQTPVYYPFAESVIKNGRIIQDNPLIIEDGRYRMDFEDLEKKLKDPRVKMAILCSPHNPVGRVWEKQELERFGNICIDNQVLVFSDEIHCDLIMPGFKHTCFQSLSEKFAHHSFAANAASKTFNLAGLQQSNLIIPNSRLRNEFIAFNETLGNDSKGGGTLFGAIATQAAYNEAENWLDDLIGYLNENFCYLKSRIENELPGITVYNLEGTYLAWLDFNSLGFDPHEIIQRIQNNAGIALDHGDWFGENGAGFERINIACSKSVIKNAVDKLVTAFK